MSDEMNPVHNEPVCEANPPSFDAEPNRLEPGIALCLSGGGYRAMLYHLGTLWRLNEVGLLYRLARVSSVSGGSITAAVLAANWENLGWANGMAAQFEATVVERVRNLASRTIDVTSIAAGALLPGDVSDKIADAYRKYLRLHAVTLQHLPDAPRFVFNATNVQTKSLWRFSKPYMGDWRVGLVMHPTLELAKVVAASSAFPPVLSPMVLELDPGQMTQVDGCTLHQTPYTTDVVLADGGVYDNLGLETTWKRCRTLLVSDAGIDMAPEPDPKRDWLGMTSRVLFLFDAQVRSLRKRQLFDAFRQGTRLIRHATQFGNSTTYTCR